MTGLDPAFAAAAAEHESFGVDWVAGAPEDLRAAYDAARGRLAVDAAPGAAVEPFALPGGTEGLLFRPPQPAGQGAVVYFHGGSWVVGSPATHAVPASRLAVAAGVPVWSVRYPLAPEHPFPAQREAGVRAVEAVLSAGGAGTRLVLAGDSAGAAVTFWSEAALPHAARTRVAGLVGFYGGYCILPLSGEGGDAGEGLSHEALLAAYRRLGPLDALRAAPGFAIADAVPADGPPCYLTCGTEDALLGNTRTLARRLEGLGRSVTLDLAPGLGHSFLHYAARVPAAQEALGRAADWIAARLSA